MVQVDTQITKVCRVCESVYGLTAARIPVHTVRWPQPRSVRGPALA